MKIVAKVAHTNVFYVPRCGECDNDVTRCDYCGKDDTFRQNPNSQESLDEIICVHTAENYIGKPGRTRHFCSKKCMESYFENHEELKNYWMLKEVIE